MGWFNEDGAADLWKQYRKKRTIELRNKLVEFYLPYVKQIAKRYSLKLPAYVDEGDLVTDGVLGLTRAIERRGKNHKSNFLGFAMFRIRGAMVDGLRSMDWPSRYVRAKAKQEGREPPAVRQPGEYLNPDTGEVTSMFDLRADPKARTPYEIVAGQDEIEHLLKVLPDEERRIVEQHVLAGIPQWKVAKRMGIAPATLSFLYRRAIDRMRWRTGLKQVGVYA